MISASASESARRAAEALSHGGGAARAPVASQRLATETNAEEDEPPRMVYWTIFTFSRAAACVTWPAIAVARSCAVRPSVSACCGVKRFPLLLLRPQLRDVAPEGVELALRLGALLRVDPRDRRARCPR